MDVQPEAGGDGEEGGIGGVGGRVAEQEVGDIQAGVAVVEVELAVGVADVGEVDRDGAEVVADLQGVGAEAFGDGGEGAAGVVDCRTGVGGAVLGGVERKDFGQGLFRKGVGEGAGEAELGDVVAVGEIDGVVREAVEAEADGEDGGGVESKGVVLVDGVDLAVEQVAGGGAGGGVERVAAGFLGAVVEVGGVGVPPGEELVIDLGDELVGTVAEEIGAGGVEGLVGGGGVAEAADDGGGIDHGVLIDERLADGVDAAGGDDITDEVFRAAVGRAGGGAEERVCEAGAAGGAGGSIGRAGADVAGEVAGAFGGGGDVVLGAEGRTLAVALLSDPEVGGVCL